MPLYLVTRPHGASHMKNTSGIHAALVDAAHRHRLPSPPPTP